MGKFAFEAPTDFIKQLGRLADVDSIAPIMIDESMPTIQNKLIKELAWHVNTGELQASIKNTKATKQKRGGYFASARPTGTDSKGIRNMEKLAYIEYGTSKQMAMPVIKTVLGDSEDTVLNTMQRVFEREVKK